MQIINQGLDLNLVYGCTRDKTLMVELEACEVSNRDVEAALRLAHQEAVKYIEPQIRLAKKVGRQKTDYKLFMITDQNRRKIENKVKRLAEPQIETALFSSTSSGDDPGYSIYSNISKREQVMDEIKRNVEEVVLREDDVDEVVLQADACRQDLAEISFQKKIVRNAVNSVMRNVVGRRIIEKGLRVDGRPLDKIRKPQFCGCGALPVLYGSSIFCIGHTPVLCRVDLGNNESSSSSSSSLYDEEYAYSDYDRRHKFVFHRGSAKKAFLGVLPPEDDFPYNVKATVIIETAKSYGDVISTNYMASICGASLALMDAGIPLKRHVAGVFMGLISDVDPSTGAINNYRILTDMDGYDLELGDMNLKVAGTWKGITGIELDIKNPPVVTAEAGLQIGIGIGIPLDIICECLKPASKGLLQVLEHMEREIDAPRHSSHSFNQNGWNWRTLDDCSYFSSLKGKSYSLDSLRSLQQLGGPAVADDDQIWDKNNHTVLTSKQKAVDKYLKTICQGTLTGFVSLIREKHGVFVEIRLSTSGLCIGFVPISEMVEDDDDDDGEQKKISDRVSIGQVISVMCIGYDPRGFLKLSLKKTMPAPN